MSVDCDSRTGSLAGSVIVITGATSGIGLAVGRLARAAGADVVAVGRRVAADERDRAPGSLLSLSLDVRRPADMARMAEVALDRFGRIDVLVAAAGILRTGPPSTVAQLPVEEWDTIIDTNLRGTFLSNRAVLPTMLRQHSGTIVNLSSTSGRQGRAYDAAYCASKFGVIGLTESLAEEVGPHGVKVHVVLPGPVDTEVWRQNEPLPRPPLMLSPERVAEVVLHLLTLPVDTLLTPLEVVPAPRRRHAPRETVTTRPSERG